MRRPFYAAAFFLAALTVAALTPHLGLAQGLPTPPGGSLRPPPPPPIKPYKPVAVTPPGPLNDASLEAFRKNLGEIAERKDRAALAKLVVAKGFFWLQDKDVADPGKSGIDNLAKAIDLDAKEGTGWEILENAAGDPTGAPLQDHKDTICAPADPQFDPQALQALAEQTGTDPSEWGYPLKDSVEVRSAPQERAAIVEKLGLYFVRVLPDSPPPTANGPAFLHVATPSGKSGFVEAEVLAPLGGDQLCYTKAGNSWMIAGYVGSGAGSP